MAGDPVLLDQPQQGFLDWHVENVLQFGTEIARRGPSHTDFRGGHQGAITRKPDRVERPQAALVEAGNFIERVEGTAVGIAGTVGKLLQLAEDCDIGLGTQQLFQLRQGGDAILAQKLPQQVGGKDGRAHNAIVPPSEQFI